MLSNLLKRLDRDDGAVELSTLRALARGAGVPEAWLISGAGSPADAVEAPPLEDDGRQAPPVGVPTRLGAFRGYEDVEQSARAQAPDVPDWAWIIAADANPLSIGNAAPSVGMLVQLARFIQQHATPDAIADVRARKK